MNKHSTNIQIRFADCDMLGHVNNAKFATYMEIARVQMVEDWIETAKDWSETGILLASITINFLSPILLNDKLRIDSCVSSIGNKSFKMDYDFVVDSPEGDVIKASGSTILVYFHYQKKVTIPVPDEWRQKINLLQETNF
jgi:acyl-CoA thioester hydrolase